LLAKSIYKKHIVLKILYSTCLNNKDILDRLRRHSFQLIFG
jgi:hypothetical protein